jgi:arylsulfatase
MLKKRPHILLIMTDQQRFDSLGCYGADWVRTPNLDKLAQEGAVFENCYVNNPICTPSRASLLTGKHLPGHGVYKLHDILPENEVLFPKRFQQMGYRTALFGKLHVSGRIYEATQRHPNDGFDIYEWCLEASIHLDSSFNGYSRWLREHHPDFYQQLKAKGRELLHVPRDCHFTHWAAERTINFLHNHKSHQPFFCIMSVFDPHNPYEDYSLEMRKLVDEARMPVPYVPGDMVGRGYVPAGEESRPYGVQHEMHHSYLGDIDSFTADDFRQMRLGYFASIALIDLEVGPVLTTLEETGLAENTIVIFTSDHGDMLGDHNLLVKGAFFYDPCTKVPLIIRWPNAPGGVRSTQLVQLHDLAATMLASAGMPAEELQQIMPESQNLAPLIHSSTDPLHEYVICCYRNTGINDQGVYWKPPIHATMLRNDRYKLNLYHADLLSHRRLEGELYDMLDDPRELKNLWTHPKYQTMRMNMTEQLLEWLLQQEVSSGSRGGEAIPDPSQQLVNALK